MSRLNYDAVRVARQLGYDKKDPSILSRIESAKTESEITRILRTARESEE